jgi:hypothetical protein
MPYDPLPATSTNAKKQITNYVYTDNSTQPATTKAWEMTYYDDGRMATHTYSLNNVYQYDWEYYYSPYGIEKALKKYYEQLLITIDATTAPNGRMLSMHYQDNTCQTNCFQGEASAAYDPCGNMISLVSHTTGVEVWARAVDKNSDATIGIYDPFNMEIPFSAQATIHPSYDQPINGPIEFRIPEQGQWELKEQLANLTKVNTTLGEMGVSASSSADDDCGDEMCGGEFASTCTKTECDKLFKNESSVEMNADYESSEYNCSFIFCCWGIYDFALHCTPTDKGLPLYDGPGKWVWAARSFIEDREANLWQWVATHYNDCIQYFPPPETPPDRKRI